MLSPTGQAGLKRLWCGAEDSSARVLFGSQRERHRVQRDRLADQRETAAVERRRPEVAQGAAMIGGGIATVGLPAIAGMQLGVTRHDPVASDLGDDRGGGNRTAFGVAGHDGYAW